MKKLLMVVDMQNDFIEGTLGTKEAELMVESVIQKIKKYKKDSAEIIFTMDTHEENYLETQEGKRLPIRHCTRGSKGWQICDAVKRAVNIEGCRIYEKGTFGSDQFAKDLADGKYTEMEQVELIGLCTDICVISNAMIAKTFLKEAEILVDSSCCAGVTPKSHENALEAMRMCQITVQ